MRVTVADTQLEAPAGPEAGSIAPLGDVAATRRRARPSPQLHAAYADVRGRHLQVASVAEDAYLLTIATPMLQRPARIPLRAGNVAHLAQLLTTAGTAGRLDLGPQPFGRRPGVAVPIVRVIHGQIETQTSMLRHVTVFAERQAALSTSTLRYRVLLPVSDAETFAAELFAHLCAI